MFRARWHLAQRHTTVRYCLFLTGCFFIVLSPVAGAIPGPGGVFVFAFGLGLALKYSHWAKRRYVAFKRRWPKHAAWTDWGLRRQSARRRKELAAGACRPSVD